MPVESIFEAVRAGMAYERLRLDAASRNIAGANVPVAPGQSATRWQAAAGTAGFGEMLGSADALRSDPAESRLVDDPGHPYADANGQVRYPAVDMAQEMTTMMSASRAYEADVRAFNLLRSMALRGLEIGAK